VSYDIEMMRLSQPGDLLAQAHRVRKEEIRRDEEGVDAVPSPEKDESRAKLVADLIALHPSLYSEPHQDGPSYGCEILTDDHECCVPYIVIRIDDALVSFSYAADFELVLPELKRVIGVFERHGYTAYDPQTDSIVTSGSTFRENAASFAATRDSVVRQLQARGEIVLGYPTPRKRFWTGAAVTILLLVAAAVLIRQHYASQTPPGPSPLQKASKEPKDLLDRQERLRKP
jgi:hypothetical protein